MPLPTLLSPGSLIQPKGYEKETPISYIVTWIKRHMPEYGPTRAEMRDRVLIVRSRTGSGKSTVLPVYVLRILRDERTPRKTPYRGRNILCTQPRVLTAIDLATEQIGGAPHYPDMIFGETVGYQTGPIS